MPGLYQSSQERANEPRGLSGKALARQRRQRRKNIAELESDLDIAVDDAERQIGKVTDAVLNNSVVQNIFDVVSRPNYVMVALTEGLLNRDPKEALAGAAREFFSGMHMGTTGRKRTFADLLKDKGFGTGGSISDVIPRVFDEEGKGLKFKRGGFFDWTARGTTGLALDIVTDPLNAVTLGVGATARQGVRAGPHFLSPAGRKALAEEFTTQLAVRSGRPAAATVSLGSAEALLDEASEAGRALRAGAGADALERESMEAARQAVARRIDEGATALADQGGVKMFGRTVVPGEVIAAPVKDAWAATVRFLDRSTAGQKVIEIGEGVKGGLGTIFDRDFLIRANETAVAIKQDYLDKVRFSRNVARSAVNDVFRGVSEADRIAISKHIDDPTRHALKEELKPVLDRVQSMYSRMADDEIQRGLLDQVRLNYTLHAYKESPKRVQRMLAALKPHGPDPTLRGSQKARVFDTFAEAERAGLHPVYDAAELMYRRALRHVDAVEAFDYFDEVKRRLGVLPETLEADDLVESLSKVEALAKSDVDSLAGVVGKHGVPLAEIRKLSPVAKTEFLRRRFGNVTSGQELERTMNKYREFSELWPDTTDISRKLAPTIHGEHMVEVAGIPNLKGVYLPESVADDITRFNEHFINQKEVNTLLRGYDVALNGFKLGVTSIWPAFHFRNAYSNVVQSFTDLGLQALNPMLHGEAAGVLWGAKGKMTTKLGEAVSWDRLRYEMQRHNVVTDYRSLFEVTDTAVPLRKGAAWNPVQWGKHAGSAIENEARASMYVAYRRRGLAPLDASRRVKKVLFDYSNISKAERDVLTRAFPFYRWLRKNLELQANRLRQTPGAIATQAKLTRQQAADPETLPKFLRGDMAFTLEADEDGNIKTVSGIGMPIRDLNLLFSERADEILQAIGGGDLTTPGGAVKTGIAAVGGIGHEALRMLSPLKVIAEIALDRDFYRMGKISENSRLRGMGPFMETISKYPGGKQVTEWLDFRKAEKKDGTVEYHTNPTKTYIFLKSYMLARAFGTADRLMDAKEADFFGVLKDPSFYTGLRFNDVNINQAHDNIEREYEKYLEQKAIIEGKRKRFEKVYRPKGQQ